MREALSMWMCEFMEAAVESLLVSFPNRFSGCIERGNVGWDNDRTDDGHK